MSQYPTVGHINCFWCLAVTKNAPMNIIYICYCPHLQVKLLCLRKCLLKIITTLQKLHQFILLTPIWEPTFKIFTNNGYYLSFWPILFYLYLKMWDIFQMLNWPFAFFLLNILCPSTLSYITNVCFQFINSICQFSCL